MSKKSGTTVSSVEFGSVEEFQAATEALVEGLDQGLRQEGMLQAALALCGTCSHTDQEHTGAGSWGPCGATWEAGLGVDRHWVTCGCVEYWPTREQREDGLRVVGYEVGFGGSLGLSLDRRYPTELWESLRTGREVSLRLTLEVDAKGFKRHKDGGLIEVRKLKVLGWVLADELAVLDEETGELL